MKVQKMISIDPEIADLLKDENASELISNLIKAHFSNSKEYQRERLNKEIAIMKAESEDWKSREKALGERIKKFLGKPATKKEIVENVKTEVILHEGAFRKTDLRQNARI